MAGRSFNQRIAEIVDSINQKEVDGMQRQADLRVTKTKRALKEAFLQLLRQKKLDRISVVELAKRAEINKGTFYLHYRDIYALYNDVLLEYIRDTAARKPSYAKMLDDPEAFVRDFFAVPADAGNDVGKYLFQPENIRYCNDLFLTLIDAVAENVYAAAPIRRTEENAMKLRFLIGGMYSQAVFLSSEKNYCLSDDAVLYLTGQIRSSFPGAFAGE